MIIGLCGKAGSGKSRIADFICNHYHAHPLAFADALRLAVAPISLFLHKGNEEQTHHSIYDGKDKPLPHINCTARDLFRGFGDVMRSYDPDAFVKLTDMKIDFVTQYYKSRGIDTSIVIEDCRYANEAEYIKSKGGVLIQIVRNETRELKPHSSEKGIPPKYIDSVVSNTGTISDLMEHAFGLADFYGLEKDEGTPVRQVAQGKGDTMYVH